MAKVKLICGVDCTLLMRSTFCFFAEDNAGFCVVCNVALLHCFSGAELAMWTWMNGRTARSVSTGFLLSYVAGSRDRLTLTKSFFYYIFF